MKIFDLCRISYKCDCGNNVELNNRGSFVECPICSTRTPLTNDIIRFHIEENQQTKVFDEIYSAGYNNIEQKNNKSIIDEYKAHAPTALNYLIKSGYNLDSKIENVKILDAACGAGWTSAAFYNHPSIINCHIHAFDISFPGVDRLKNYIEHQKDSRNTISFSTQDALDMKFAESQFDLIVGSSILHHFDDYTSYLKGCNNILKDGGKAIFGEPFAVGYGLIYSAMKIAAHELKIKEPSIESLYTDSSLRIANFGHQEKLSKLVDKHLFFYDEIENACLASGFKNFSIEPIHNIEYFDGYIISELYNDMGVENKKLRKKTIDIYRVIYNMFKSEKTFNKTLSPFNYIIFEK